MTAIVAIGPRQIGKPNLMARPYLILNSKIIFTERYYTNNNLRSSNISVDLLYKMIFYITLAKEL